MEKKTIGGFIAALRKANGMTQRELAERLNVSDKTVSRWERDEGAPDLSAIPAIAEIFGVTCDELLRGQRKSPAERESAGEGFEPSPRVEQQRKFLLRSALSQYQNLTYIAMGVSLVGLIVALICNLAFLKAVLGFLMGCIFFAASVICQVIFLNRAFLGAGDTEDAALGEYKSKVIGLGEKSFGLTAALLGFTFPMLLVGDAHVGLTVGSLLALGSLGAVSFLGIYAVAVFFVNGSLLKNGVFALPERDAQRYHHNRKLKTKYGKRLAWVLCLTLLVHAVGFETLWSTHALSGFYGISFNDYESFVEYMEQDIPATAYDPGSGTVAMTPVPEAQVGETVYYDRYGNAITEEEALTRTIEDSQGNVLCTYIQRNESVSSIRYSRAVEGTVLPIQVITNRDMRSASNLSGIINGTYCLLYPLELLAVVLAYFKKRMQ